jgi:thioredoxin-related protein
VAGTQKTAHTITSLLALVVFLAAQATAEDYAAALRRAKKEDKPVVLYFYSDYCPYCDAMDGAVLTDKLVASLLVRDTVYLRVDVDKNRALATKHAIRGYPTTSLLGPTGKPIAQVPGYIEKEEFLKILGYLKGKHYKFMTLRQYMNTKPG